MLSEIYFLAVETQNAGILDNQISLQIRWPPRHVSYREIFAQIANGRKRVDKFGQDQWW